MKQSFIFQYQILSMDWIKFVGFLFLSASFYAMQGSQRILNSLCGTTFSLNTEVHGKRPCILGPMGPSDKGDLGACVPRKFFHQNAQKDGICKWPGPNCSEFNMAFMQLWEMNTVNYIKGPTPTWSRNLEPRKGCSKGMKMESVQRAHAHNICLHFAVPLNSICFFGLISLSIFPHVFLFLWFWHFCTEQRPFQTTQLIRS